MKLAPLERPNLSALLDRATDAIATAIAGLAYAAQQLLALIASEPDVATRAAVARSKTVIGELDAQRRADDSRPFYQRGGL
ncbi:hypothetical protein BH11PSE13_BH11PSE13_07340 [soil metagenome]